MLPSPFGELSLILNQERCLPGGSKVSKFSSLCSVFAKVWQVLGV